MNFKGCTAQRSIRYLFIISTYHSHFFVDSGPKARYKLLNYLAIRLIIFLALSINIIYLIYALEEKAGLFSKVDKKWAILGKSSGLEHLLFTFNLRDQGFLIR